MIEFGNTVLIIGSDYPKICCDTEFSTGPNKATWVIMNEDYTLFTSNGEFENPWDVTSWICNETIAKGNPTITIPKIDIIVSGCDANEANGNYILLDSTQTGKDRKWINMDEPEIEIWYEDGEWMIGDEGGFTIAGARSDADDPVSATNWEPYEEEYGTTVAPTLVWASDAPPESDEEEPLPTIPPGKRAFSISGAGGDFADINGVYIEETYTTSGSIWRHSTNDYITFEERGDDVGDEEWEQWHYKINRGNDKQFITYDGALGGQRIDYPFTGFETQTNWNNNSFNWDIHIEYENEWTGGDWDGYLEYKLTFSQVNEEESGGVQTPPDSGVINKIIVNGFAYANNTGFESLDGEYINDGSNQRFVNGNDVIGTNAVIRWVRTNEEGLDWAKPTKDSWCILSSDETMAIVQLGGTENDVQSIECSNTSMTPIVDITVTASVTITVS